MQPPLPFDARSHPRTVAPSHLVFVRHPRARRYIIRVEPDSRVRVTLPRWGSKREARSFVERERRWIEKERARIALEVERPADRISTDQERALRKQASRELPERLLALASGFGLAVRRVSVRNQRWRWGSCSPKRHICLNWRLIAMPASVRDYVMIHELMHIKRMDHSPAFWKLVADRCPGYQEARQWLRDWKRTGSMPAV